MGLPFAGPDGQEQLVQRMGLVVAPLIDRVLLNFLSVASSGQYLDGRNPWRWARTSTITHHNNNIPTRSGCGGGGPFGLDVDDDNPVGLVYDSVGAAAALPAEVQAIDT